MTLSAIQLGVGAYRQWKGRVGRALVELGKWLDADDRTTAETTEAIQARLAELEADRLMLAVVSSQQSHVSSLVNALLYPALGQSVLPAEMPCPPPCPVTILWDETRSEAYLRLLPIETRAQDRPLCDFAADPKHWVQYPLANLTETQQASTLTEIAETKSVKAADASRLGLTPLPEFTLDPAPPDSRVTIPKWRQAIVSIPHPMLKQGLVMLVTPDLTSLDREPEITTHLLNPAQMVVFLLDAYRGAGAGDLEIWQRHLKGFQSQRQQRLTVVLDQSGRETSTPDIKVGRRLSDRVSAASVALGVDAERILAVASEEGLSARRQRDQSQLRRSGIGALEQVISTRLLEAKHELFSEHLEENIGEVVKQHRERISAQMTRVRAQLEDLELLHAKSEKVIGQVIAQTREQRELYLKAVLRFQTQRTQLLAETQLCQELLARRNIEAIITEAHRQMVGSWTTRGLGRAMRALFDVLRQRMQMIIDESERLRKLVRTTYQEFRDEHGFELDVPKVFVPTRYHVELELLYQEVDLFRHSPVMVFNEQARVIERFHQQIVSRARVLFDQLRANIDPWVRDALQPIADAINEHKETMERRLASLKQVNGSSTDLKQRIQTTQSELLELTKKLTALRNIQNTLYHAPMPQQPFDRPTLVAERQ